MHHKKGTAFAADIMNIVFANIPQACSKQVCFIHTYADNMSPDSFNMTNVRGSSHKEEALLRLLCVVFLFILFCV